MDFFHSGPHCTHHTAQAILHALERKIQHADFIFRIDINALGQVARRNVLEMGAHLLERPQHSARQRSEEHKSELQSLMRISYAVFCLKKKKNANNTQRTYNR